MTIVGAYRSRGQAEEMYRELVEELGELADEEIETCHVEPYYTFEKLIKKCGEGVELFTINTAPLDVESYLEESNS
jgi:metal-dependent hydrolase (beta-lactamase superfamily II)